MRIDIWSDIVCPFCYVGKRNLEQALAEFEHRDEVEVVWHSFELDPSATEHPAGSLPEMIAGKYQMPLEQANCEPGVVGGACPRGGFGFQLASGALR